MDLILNSTGGVMWITYGAAYSRALRGRGLHVLLPRVLLRFQLGVDMSFGAVRSPGCRARALFRGKPLVGPCMCPF